MIPISQWETDSVRNFIRDKLNFWVTQRYIFEFASIIRFMLMTEKFIE